MSTISVLVPVYNTAAYLPRCLESILCQTYTDFEIVLVDDGSTDGSGKICDEYAVKDSRIKVIHQPNGGRSAARNTCLEYVFHHSNSEYLAFVDSDDWIAPRNLELLLEACTKFHVDISMGRWESREEKKEEPSLKCVDILLQSTKDAYTRKGTDVGDYLWGNLYRKSIFKDIQFPLGKNFEDIYMVPRILFQVQKIAVVDAVLYYYFQNPNGIVNSPWSIEKIEAFNARESEIEFFDNLGYPELCRIHVKGYIDYLLMHLEELKKDPEKNKISIQILEEKRKAHFNHYFRYLNLNDESDGWLATKAFPKRMWFYWHLKAIQKKMERFLR